MTLNEELDVIIKDCKIQLSPETNDKSMLEVSSDKLKSELLALFERKLNEAVPEYPLSVCVSVAEVRIRRDVVTDMQQNIKKVLEEK